MEPSSSQSEVHIRVCSNKEVAEWWSELKKLLSIVGTQPNAANAAITHGLFSKCNHILCTTPNVGNLLYPLEHTTQTKLILTLTQTPSLPISLMFSRTHTGKSWFELALRSSSGKILVQSAQKYLRYR